MWVRDFLASFSYPKHSSSPLTKVRNGFKSFLSLHSLLVLTQWSVYVFFTLPLQLFMYGVEIFPLHSHHARLTSVFHSLVCHSCFMPLCPCYCECKMTMYGATYHSYLQRLSGDQFLFQLMHHNFNLLTKSLYMFRAPTCPSSGGQTIHTPSTDFKCF